MNSLYCEVNTMLHNNLLVDILHYIVVIMSVISGRIIFNWVIIWTT